MVSKQLAQALRLIEAFRMLDRLMASEQMAVFLQIALSPNGTTSRELRKLTGLSQSAIAWSAAYFGKTRYRGNPGLDMLSERPDPTHGLRIIYELNDKGRSFAATLEVIMGSSSTTVDRDFMGAPATLEEGSHPILGVNPRSTSGHG